MGGYGVQAGGHFVALPLPIYNPIPPTKSTSFCYAIAGLHSGLHFTLQLHSNVSGPRVHAVKKNKGKWQELKALLLTQSVAASWCVENLEVGFRGGQE